MQGAVRPFPNGEARRMVASPAKAYSRDSRFAAGHGGGRRITTESTPNCTGLAASTVAVAKRQFPGPRLHKLMGVGGGSS